MAEKQIDTSGMFEEFFVEKNITVIEANSITKEAFENVDDNSIQENISPRIILRVIFMVREGKKPYKCPTLVFE